VQDEVIRLIKGVGTDILKFIVSEKLLKNLNSVNVYIQSMNDLIVKVAERRRHKAMQRVFQGRKQYSRLLEPDCARELGRI